METKEFDTLLTNIRSKVEELGGYIESSEISGSSYYSLQGNRYAWMTLRIPADKLDGFVTIVSELGNVTSKNEYYPAVCGCGEPQKGFGDRADTASGAS